MGSEEIEHRAEHRRVTQAAAQRLGREAGEREQALGAAFAFEQPAERAEREGFRINGG